MSQQARLLKQLHVQSDGAHEEVHAAEAVGRHGRRQGLGESDSVKDAILDSENQPCLLVMGCTDTHSSKELPDVDVLSGINATRENVR